MKIPREWIEEIVVRLKENKSFFKLFSNDIKDSEYYEVIQRFLNSDSNREWQFSPNLEDTFREFCVSTIAHQCMGNMHPLTCGVGGGTHADLVPRIHSNGDCYLVCPTCGWIQLNKK